MQDEKRCPDCGNDDVDYKASDRHRGYYECGCGEEFAVDYYA